MWANFRFYLAGLLMCIGCVLPAAALSLPEETMSIILVPAVFFAGGGLLYMIWNLYWRNHDGEWKDNHELILRIMAIVSGALGIALLIVIKCVYGGSTFIFYNVLFQPDKDVASILLRVLATILCGISVYPIFCAFTGKIDMSVHHYIRTTYNSSGQVIDTKNVSHQIGEHVVSYFFFTVLLGIFGVMSSSLPLAIFLLILNIKNIIPNKIVRNIVFILGLIGSIIYLLFSLYEGYNFVSESKDVYIAVLLMPIMFAILMCIYYQLFTRFEPFSTVLLVIIFTFVLIFVAYIASYGVSIGLTQLFKILKDILP